MTDQVIIRTDQRSPSANWNLEQDGHHHRIYFIIDLMGSTNKNLKTFIDRIIIRYEWSRNNTGKLCVIMTVQKIGLPRKKINTGP